MRLLELVNYRGKSGGENIVSIVLPFTYTSTLKFHFQLWGKSGRKLERRKHSYNFKINYPAIPRVH